MQWWKKLISGGILAVLPAIHGCEPLPCLSNPGTRIGVVFLSDSAGSVREKPFPMDGFYLKQGNLELSGEDLSPESPGKMVTALQIPLPTAGTRFELGWKIDGKHDSIPFSFTSALHYGGEACGFYYGFRKLEAGLAGGPRIRQVRILNSEGDSTLKNHVAIFW
jgi:hypothetical protein